MSERRCTTTTTSTFCVDSSEETYIQTSRGLQRVQLKDVHVGDSIMTVADDLKVHFVPVFLVSLHPSSHTVPLLELTAVARNGQVIRHRLVGSHMVQALREGKSKLIPTREVQVGDQMLYVAGPEAVVELIPVRSIQPSTAEALVHIWTTAVSHCANGIVTSARVEGDYGLLGHILGALLYFVHPQLPTVLYRFLKVALAS